MLHQSCLTDWHQIFLVAAGFLSAILLMWSQFWVRSLYEEESHDKRAESDRRFSTHLARLWLSVGLLFALCAFGFTCLDFLSTRQLVPLCPTAYQMRLMERLATSFLMGAFDITFIGVLEQISNAWGTSMKKGVAKPIVYGEDFIERRYNKRCLFIAFCIALLLVLAFSLLACLLPAFKLLPPCWWLWLALCSVLIPGLICWSRCWESDTSGGYLVDTRGKPFETGY